MSDGCRDLMTKILNTDPAQRIRIDEIRKHEWYTQVNVRDYGGIIVGLHPIPVDLEIVN